MERWKLVEEWGVVLVILAGIIWVFLSFLLAIEFLLLAIGVLLIGDGSHYDEPYPKLIGAALVFLSVILFFSTKITFR